MNNRPEFGMLTGSTPLTFPTPSEVSSSQNVQSFVGSSSKSILVSRTFCTVCGSFSDRLVLRKSGLKCPQCVGHPSKRRWCKLQKQQAQQLLSQVSGSSFHIMYPFEEELSVRSVDRGVPSSSSNNPREEQPSESALISETVPLLRHDGKPAPTIERLNLTQLPIKEYINGTVCFQKALQQHSNLSSARCVSPKQPGDAGNGATQTANAHSSLTNEPNSQPVSTPSMVKRSSFMLECTTTSVPLGFCRQSTAVPHSRTSAELGTACSQEEKASSDFPPARLSGAKRELDIPCVPGDPAATEGIRAQGGGNVQPPLDGSRKSLLPPPPPPPPPRPSRRIIQKLCLTEEPSISVPKNRVDVSQTHASMPVLSSHSFTAVTNTVELGSASFGNLNPLGSSQASSRTEQRRPLSSRQVVSTSLHRSSSGTVATLVSMDPYSALPGAPRDADSVSNSFSKRSCRMSNGSVSAGRASAVRIGSQSSSTSHGGRCRACSSSTRSCGNPSESAFTSQRGVKSRCLSEPVKPLPYRNSDSAAVEKMPAPWIKPKALRAALQTARVQGSKSLDGKKSLPSAVSQLPSQSLPKQRYNNGQLGTSPRPAQTSSSVLSNNIHKTLEHASAFASAAAARTRARAHARPYRPALCSMELSSLSTRNLDVASQEDNFVRHTSSSSSTASSCSRGDMQLSSASVTNVPSKINKPNVSLYHIGVSVVTPSAWAPNKDKKLARSSPRKHYHKVCHSSHSPDASVGPNSPRCTTPKSGRIQNPGRSAAVVRKGKFTITRYSHSHYSGTRGGGQPLPGAEALGHSAAPPMSSERTSSIEGSCSVEVKKIAFELHVRSTLAGGGELHCLWRNLYTDFIPAFTQVKLVAEGSGLLRSLAIPSSSIPSLRIATEAFIEQRRVECQRCLDAITREPVLMRHPAVLRLLGLTNYTTVRPPDLRAKLLSFPSTADSPLAAKRATDAAEQGGAGGAPDEASANAPVSLSQAVLTSQALDSMRDTFALQDFTRSQSQNTGLVSNQSSVLRRNRLDRFTQEDLEAVQLGNFLGRGTFGTVYQGLLQTNDGPLIVAVKELNLSAETSPEIIQRILNELNILCNTQHKNIIRFLGSVYLPETYRLRVFTEYLECGTISSMVRRFGALPLLAIQKYMTQILTGLAHLHSLNIVHRDLKGDNILLNKRGKVRLADFGCSDTLAQQVDVRMQVAATTSCEEKGDHVSQPQNGESATCERAGKVGVPPTTVPVAFPVGTPLWMAPEVIHGELSELGKKASPAAADIWAVGCIGIEMLDRAIWDFSDANTHPFAVMYHIARSKKPPDGLLSEEELKDSLQGSGTESDRERIEALSLYRDFLMRCLELKPEDRWTAQELLMHPFFNRTFSRHLRWLPPRPPIPPDAG